MRVGRHGVAPNTSRHRHAANSKSCRHRERQPAWRGGLDYEPVVAMPGLFHLRHRPEPLSGSRMPSKILNKRCRVDLNMMASMAADVGAQRQVLRAIIRSGKLVRHCQCAGSCRRFTRPRSRQRLQETRRVHRHSRPFAVASRQSIQNLSRWAAKDFPTSSTWPRLRRFFFYFNASS